MPVSIYFALFIIMAIIGYIDLKTKKIANYWSLFNIFSYIFLIFFFPKHYELSWATFFIPLVILAVGFSLYMLKIMGGGDSKYLATLYLLIPQQLHEQAFECLAYSTVLVGFSLFLINILQNFAKIKVAIGLKDIATIKEVFGKKFSFAPVIFLSWIMFGWVSKIFL